MGNDLLDKPYWERVLSGEEPVFHDGYSGHDWAEEQRDAYWKALHQCAAELRAARAVCEAASRPGITDFGFSGEHDPDDMHDLRDALEAYRRAAKDGGGE